MFDSSIKILFSGSGEAFANLMHRVKNIFTLAFTACFLAGCSENSPRKFQGYVEGEYVYIAAPLGGSLAKLAVVRGGTVKPGDLLFELERAAEAAALEQAEKNLAQAKTSLVLSENEFSRREKLRADSGVISVEELDKARARRDADSAQAAAQQAAFDRARWAYDQKSQSSPASAQVHDTLFRPGEFVGAGSPVVVLLPPENLKVRFFVPQETLPQIKIGESVPVKCDGAARTFTATVNYISTQAEFTPPVIYSRENRAKLVFMIEAKFSPADAAELRPGQPADVKLN